MDEFPSDLLEMAQDPMPQALPVNTICDESNEDSNSTVSSIGDEFSHQGAALSNAATGGTEVLRRNASSNALEQVRVPLTTMQRVISSNGLARMGMALDEERLPPSGDALQMEREETNVASERDQIPHRQEPRRSLIPPAIRRMIAGERGEPEAELLIEDEQPMLVTQEEDGTFTDLLAEAEHYLSMSMLVYMYAKLREMSVLGYTSVDFRAIDPNSHLPWRPSGDFNNQESSSFVEGHMPNYGDAGVDLDDSSCRSLLQSSMSHASNRHVRYLLNTKTATFIIRTVLGELEREKRDVKEGGKSIESNHDHDISIIKEFRTWVEGSRSDQLNDAAEAAIIDLRRRVARARWKRAIAAVRRKVVMRRMRRLSNDHFPYGSFTRDTRQEDFMQCETASAALGGHSNNLRASLRARTAKMARRGSVVGGTFTMQHRLVQEHFGLRKNNMTHGNSKDSDCDAVPPPALNRRQSFNPEDIITDDMINEAMDNSLPKYFKKGSVLNHMVESGIEVAWFGDRHPNEAIFCICICRKTKMVTIVFRGSVTAHNWSHNMKVMMSEQANPLAGETYGGRRDNIWLHTGFSLYLLKRRRDDGRRKMDEIFDKVRKIGRELSPDGRYSVSVAGHSLGGALATIFSFFAATVPDFTRVAPVRTFTFASPRVGDRAFLDAYRHLERTRRVQHARIAACGDIVPLMPTHTFTTEEAEIAKMYYHVGLQVRLNETSALGKYKTGKALDVAYSLPNDLWSDLQMRWKNSFVMNMNTISGFGKAHFLSSYQKRLHFSRQYRLGLSLTDYFSDDRRGKLKTLEEYYEIKANPRQRNHPLQFLDEKQRLRLKAAFFVPTVVFMLYLASTSNLVSSLVDTCILKFRQSGGLMHQSGMVSSPDKSYNASTQQGNDGGVSFDLEFGDFLTMLEENFLNVDECPVGADVVGEFTLPKPRMGAGAWGTGLTPAFMYRSDL